MTDKLNQLTAGACSLLIASFAIMTPGYAQFDDVIKKTSKEQIDDAFADCPGGMEATTAVDMGNGNSIYTCFFIDELLCPAGAPCAATVQHCRPAKNGKEAWNPLPWNIYTLDLKARGTPPLEFVISFQCWGEQ